MQTVADLINSTLRLIGVLASGEVPTANEQNDVFLSLNDMIESFSTENLIIPAKIREVFNITASKETYTMGPGGDFDTTRPQLIENALIVPTGTNPELELPMTIFNVDQYADILVKTIQSSIPLYLYNDNANPLCNISLWPVPSVSTQIVLYSWKPLASFATVNDVVVLPPGYKRMLRYNLAVEIAPEFGKTNLDEKVLAIALQSLGNVKRMNQRPQLLGLDAALLNKGTAFNWITGDTV